MVRLALKKLPRKRSTAIAGIVTGTRRRPRDTPSLAARGAALVLLGLHPIIVAPSTTDDAIPETISTIGGLMRNRPLIALRKRTEATNPNSKNQQASA
jgi:hypothetical protein